VTIIAGFQCTDGLLMCSDTEQSFSPSDNKTQTRKVPVFHLGKLTIAIGGSGDGALVDFITQDLVKHLAAEDYNWSTIEAGLNNYAKRIFSRHIRVYAGFPPAFVPEVSFLIAIAMGSQGRLFKWEKNFVYAVPLMQHTSIGIGTIQSEQLLTEIQFFYPSELMLFFAVRMMYQVKQLVQGCGGKTEAVFIQVGRELGLVVHHGIFIVDEIEHVTMMVDEFLVHHVLPLVANTALSKESVESQLETAKRGLMKLRERYGQLMLGSFVKEQEKEEQK